jgi:hypothetical protein
MVRRMTATNRLWRHATRHVAVVAVPQALDLRKRFSCGGRGGHMPPRGRAPHAPPAPYLTGPPQPPRPPQGRAARPSITDRRRHHAIVDRTG